METADIVIIGGGIVGVSIAYNIAKVDRNKKIIIAEKEKLLGQGSTGKCAGGVRAQFGTKINIQLSIESLKFFENFSKEMEYETTFYQNGYLFLLTKDEEVNAFKNNVELQNKLGINSRLVTKEEIKKIFPELNLDDVKMGSFYERDGFISPADVMNGYEKQIRKLGVKILTETEVIKIETRNNKIQSVITTNGKISTPIVVNAAGPYAKKIGEMIDIKIPVEPVRRHIFVTRPFPYIKDPFPLTIDFSTNFYFHRESQGILLGRTKLDEPPGFNTSVDWNYLLEVIEVAVHRVPILEKAEIATGWAGLYEVTPDAHPIVGEVPEIEGFYCANGFSGHGFMHAPAIGKIMAELILTGRTSIDISPLSITRFTHGRIYEEGVVI
jgi:sarcosine oxidase subunit beta